MTLYALDGIAPVVHPTAWVHPDATVIGRVELGPEVSIWPQAVLRGDYGEIRVGARTSIQDGTVLHTTEQHPTVVGTDCVVGHRAHLEGCLIGNRVLIGSNSVVLNRVVVEDGALVGAGALVAEGTVVPADHRALGVPARITRRRGDGGLRRVRGRDVRGERPAVPRRAHCRRLTLSRALFSRRRRVQSCCRADGRPGDTRRLAGSWRRLGSPGTWASNSRGGRCQGPGGWQN